MGKNSDMDWGLYIKMNQAQNLRNDPKKAKQITFRKFKEDPACPLPRIGIYRIIWFHKNT